MDYLLPDLDGCPSWELGETVTPSPPHNPIGARASASRRRSSRPAVVNAVMDALKALRGVRTPICR